MAEVQSITARVYVCQCIEAGTYQGTEGQIRAFDRPQHEDYGPNGSGDTRMFGVWALVTVKDLTIEFEPLDQAKLAADMIARYEKKLNEHRAQAFRTEQFLEGRIAKFKALTFKDGVEGEIIPSCTKPTSSVDADDADFDDIPF
jgi:hypothetical protein